MWLPETAVDLATLEVLAAHGILFTILAPAPGEAHPTCRTNHLAERDSRTTWIRPVRTSVICRAARPLPYFSITVGLAREVAFEGLLIVVTGLSSISPENFSEEASRTTTCPSRH